LLLMWFGRDLVEIGKTVILLDEADCVGKMVSIVIPQIYRSVGGIDLVPEHSVPFSPLPLVGA